MYLFSFCLIYSTYTKPVLSKYMDPILHTKKRVTISNLMPPTAKIFVPIVWCRIGFSLRTITCVFLSMEAQEAKAKGSSG